MLRKKMRIALSLILPVAKGWFLTFWIIGCNCTADVQLQAKEEFETVSVWLSSSL